MYHFIVKIKVNLNQNSYHDYTREIPSFYFQNLRYQSFHNNVSSVTLNFCDDDSVSEEVSKLFRFHKFILMFAVPTVIMVVCYTGVIYALWVSSAQLTKLTSVSRSAMKD